MKYATTFSSKSASLPFNLVRYIRIKYEILTEEELLEAISFSKDLRNEIEFFLSKNDFDQILEELRAS